MALLLCTGCTSRYAVGAPRCPECGSTEFEEDHDMPKITVHGGASNAAQDTEVNEQPTAAPAPDYEDWTVDQLREQLTDRGLPKTGKRDDLVKRLVEDDAEKDTEE